MKAYETLYGWGRVGGPAIIFWRGNVAETPKGKMVSICKPRLTIGRSTLLKQHCF